jgi:hypothetical protein
MGIAHLGPQVCLIRYWPPLLKGGQLVLFDRHRVMGVWEYAIGCIRVSLVIVAVSKEEKMIARCRASAEKVKA